MTSESIERYCDIIRRDCQRAQSSHGIMWQYDIDTKYSSYHIDNVHVHNIRMHGMDFDHVYIQLFYTISRYSVTRTKTIPSDRLQNAVGKLWELIETYSLCPECCDLIEKGNSCKNCAFYLLSGTKETCSICQEICCRTRLSCGHFFHKVCLLNLEYDNLRCPNCRTPQTDDFIQYLFFNQDGYEESDSSDSSEA
jgi:hypothetical protein